MRLLIFLSFLILAFCNYEAAPYAEWAHSHLVWIDAKDQNESKIYDMVKNYQARGIPVGAVNIDSMWSECINTFTVDRKKFPNMEQLVKNLHAQNIRVILWTTSLINQECPEFKEGKEKNYFLNNGKTVKWWHGKGAFIDFFNPQAKKWFTSLMDRVIDMGFDGWKCDGADPIILLLRPWPYSPGLKRYITYREYANQYYGTFYNYTKTKNPEALIMARPVDSYQGKLYINYAPKYVMFMGWVGDQHNDVDGFRYAMENIIHSASQNYLNFGFDIGGYKTSGDSKKYLFLRWVQIGSLLPFMENGGNGIHQPWFFDEETVDIYKKFVLLHYDLKEFFLSAGTEAYKKGKSVVQPLVPDRKIVELVNHNNLGYVLWNTFLVEPIFQESGYVEVVFPEKYKWIYYFNHSRVFQGGSTSNLGIKLSETPLFIRSNTVFPMKKQLWVSLLEEGNIKTTVVAGNYSDNVTVEYQNSNLLIQVQRSYKTSDIQESMRVMKTIVVRLMGVDLKLMSLTNSQQLRKTEYENECEFDLPLNSPIQFKGVLFSSSIQPPEMVSQ